MEINCPKDEFKCMYLALGSSFKDIAVYAYTTILLNTNMNGCN